MHFKLHFFMVHFYSQKHLLEFHSKLITLRKIIHIDDISDWIWTKISLIPITKI